MHLLTLFVFSFVLLADQYLKLWIQANVPLHGFLPVNTVLSLTHSANHGILMSAFSGNTLIWQYMLSFVSTTMLVVTTAAVYQKDNTRKEHALALALLWGGGLSNSLDRILHQHVVDYLLFHLGPWSWPAIVNCADLAITFGAILLIASSPSKKVLSYT